MSTAERRSGDTTSTTPTTDSWRAYYQRGTRRVQFVGLLGNAAGIYGAIKRVTTANVFVLIDGAAKAEPFHPADLRPTNVWPGMSTTDHVECKECGTRFEGGRTEARQARWEPWSTASRQALDHGPMVCPVCVDQLLAAVIDALRAHAACS